MIQHIERFNRQAVKHNLSAGAILLWQHLFFAMQRKGTFAKVQQHTSVLMASLQVSNQGLFKMRQTLIDKGFLAISHDEHQHVYYTLMINGKVVGEKGDSRVVSDIPKIENVGVASAQKSAPATCDPLAEGQCLIKQKTSGIVDGYHGRMWASAPTNKSIKSHPATDIILTNRYRQYIDAFCDTFGPAPKADLLQWADMRRKNGWTLTLWGLEAVLKNLVELSAGDAVQMANIVAQSVKRRWKGFFALKTKAQPSGEKMLRQEQKQEWQQQRQTGYGSRFKNAVTQKFAPEGRDLSFLVV